VGFTAARHRAIDWRRQAAPGKVYFLNTQKLGSATSFVKTAFTQQRSLAGEMLLCVVQDALGRQ